MVFPLSSFNLLKHILLKYIQSIVQKEWFLCRLYTKINYIMSKCNYKISKPDNWCFLIVEAGARCCGCISFLAFSPARRLFLASLPAVGYSRSFFPKKFHCVLSWVHLFFGFFPSALLVFGFLVSGWAQQKLFSQKVPTILSNYQYWMHEIRHSRGSSPSCTQLLRAHSKYRPLPMRHFVLFGV